MFRFSRSLHKWVGIFSCLFMIVVASTGLLLAWKKKADWLQPPAQKGSKLESPEQVASLADISEAVFSAGIPELQSIKDVDRFELHTSKGIFKVTSKEGYHEVQVDASTARVLSRAKRNDQLVENIHDLTFFNPLLRETLLPLVALSLIVLGVTGLVLFSTPVFRRWQFKKGQASGRDIRAARPTKKE